MRWFKIPVIFLFAFLNLHMRTSIQTKFLEKNIQGQGTTSVEETAREVVCAAYVCVVGARTQVGITLHYFAVLPSILMPSVFFVLIPWFRFF